MRDAVINKIPSDLLAPIGTGRRYQRTLGELERRGFNNQGLALLLQGQDTSLYSDEELAWLIDLPNHLLELAGGTTHWRGQLLLIPGYLSKSTIGGWLWQLSSVG